MQWLRLIGIVIGSLVIGNSAYAREVTAIGSAAIYSGNIGSARNQALQNAQRQAVEQGVGALISTETISRNFEIIKDEILSSSSGFVANYEILEEGPTSDNTSYQVKIKADVQDAKIKDKLTALRILHKQMGNKRVMVIYNQRDPNALPRTMGAVSTAMAAIRDELNRTGFRVFNDQIMNQVYQAIEKAAVVDRPADSLIAMALDQQAEILVSFEMIGGQRDQRGGMFYAAKTTVRMSVYDASTGRQIADVVTYGKELASSPPGPYDWELMLGKAGARASLEASEQAVTKITDFYQNVGDLGFAYLLVFRNYSAEQEDSILDYLENTSGFKQLTELKNNQNYLEIEIFSSESKSRLRRKIRKDLKGQGIELVAQESDNNRIVFVNPTPLGDAASRPESLDSKR
ncbi:flagellar assembly protein T N-terminal domain-containing protein [Deltaproteobacteria bacterium TL4]